MPDGSGPALGWSELLGMGIAAGAQLAVGFGLGWLIDSLTGTTPVFTLIGVLLGVVGAVSYTVVQFRKYLHTPPDPE